jgi:hypothetical protein
MTTSNNKTAQATNQKRNTCIEQDLTKELRLMKKTQVDLDECHDGMRVIIMPFDDT